MTMIEVAIEELKMHQTQLDMDGVMVGVSRQALEELLAHVATPAPPALIAGLEPVAGDPIEDLVQRFSEALLAKLRLAQSKGRSGWDQDDWEDACRTGLMRHINKGDPRDVAAYCAFMWHHGWSTAELIGIRLGE